MRAVTLGKRKIIALVDYLGPYGPLADLFPDVAAEQWEPYRARYPETFATPETWRAAFTCYLVRAPANPAEGLTLVDSGLGPDDPETPGALLSELAACGVAPEQIERVVFTHLHSDHIGWNLTADGAPSFPNARYLFERGAWEALHAAAEAGGDNDLAGVSAQLQRLAAHGVVEQFIAGAEIAPGCVSLSSDGHAPGHISVLVESGVAGARRGLIVGDAWLHPAQVSEPEWASSYDEDAQQARAARGRLLDLAEADDLLLAVSHIAPDGFGRVIREGAARRWQPL